MDVCPRCGKSGHPAGVCSRSGSSAPAARLSSAPAPRLSSVPPPGSIPPGAGTGDFAVTGSFGISGAYASLQNPVHRSLRLLKTQLNLAIGQRAEDPERAWLEAMSVRERLVTLAASTQEDPLLSADVDRFRGKLEDRIKKLTLEVGDEVVAPLYSWVDLIRQRAQIDGEIETACARVAEARASRGLPTAPAPATLDEASAALDAREKQLTEWRAAAPIAPPPEALAIWNERGGNALRASLPADLAVVAARGQAAQKQRLAIETHGATVVFGESPVEKGVFLGLGAVAIFSSTMAFSRDGSHPVISALAIVTCASFAAAGAAWVQSRRRANHVRGAAIDWVWNQTLVDEQTMSLEIEAGWLRALVSALRARRAFDARKGEGGQLAELVRWRPDLEDVVADVAKASLPPPPF